MTYNSSDAWLLTSLTTSTGVFKRKCTLIDLIASGDMLNRAIFNYDELNEGLCKLIHIGYVEITDQNFKLTPLFKKDKKKHCKKTKNFHEDWNEYKKLLMRKFSEVEQIEYKEIITEAKFDASFNAYSTMAGNLF